MSNEPTNGKIETETYSNPATWAKWEPCPYCGSTWMGGIEHQGVTFTASPDGGNPETTPDEPLGIISAWCVTCGALLVEDSQIVLAGADPETRDVRVQRSALTGLLQWIADDPAVDTAGSGDEIARHWLRCAAALGHYVCEFCSFPPGRGVAKTADGTVVCGYHAEALESGAWDNDEWTLYDLSERPRTVDAAEERCQINLNDPEAE